MKQVEIFTWNLPPDIWRKRGGRSSVKMSREEAERKHQGATPILSSREVRTLPDTEEEIRAAQLREYPQYRKRD